MKKNIPLIIFSTCFAILGVFYVMAGINNVKPGIARAALTAAGTPTFYVASTTAITLTTTSKTVLATSTPTKRVAASFSSINCTTGGLVSLLMNNTVAVANTGLGIFASSTVSLSDYPNLPVVQGQVTGITSVGTCTLLVTEWRLIQ